MLQVLLLMHLIVRVVLFVIFLMVAIALLHLNACAQVHEKDTAVRAFTNTPPWTIWEYEGDIQWKGVWDVDQRRGRGMCYWRNGAVYMGDWSAHQPNGVGTLFYPNGITLSGQWRNGRLIRRSFAHSFEEYKLDSCPDQGAVLRDTRATLHMVSIGIDQYVHLEALGRSDCDALRIAELWSSLHEQHTQLAVLINERASGAAVQRSLHQTLCALQPKDTLILYFSGHALPGRMLLSDFNGYGSTISYRALFQKIVQRQPAIVWMFFDACYSGSAVEVLEAVVPDSVRSRWSVFCSSTAEQKSLQKEGQISVFTQYLESGLLGAADADGDGIVLSGELFNYLRWHVSKATSGMQTPVFWGNEALQLSP